MSNYKLTFRVFRVLACIFTLFPASASLANVNSVEFRFSLLSVLAKNAEAIEFYEENGFKPIWVGGDRYARKGHLIFSKSSKIHQSMPYQLTVMILII